MGEVTISISDLRGVAQHSLLLVRLFIHLHLLCEDSTKNRNTNLRILRKEKEGSSPNCTGIYE